MQHQVVPLFSSACFQGYGIVILGNDLDALDVYFHDQTLKISPKQNVAAAPQDQTLFFLEQRAPDEFLKLRNGLNGNEMRCFRMNFKSVVGEKVYLFLNV